jgi:very-short-patch-repair endonuclease
MSPEVLHLPLRRHRRHPAAYLARFGIEVIRFTNADVAEDIEVMLEAVKRRNHPQTPPW